MCQETFVETFYYTKEGDDKIYPRDILIPCSHACHLEIPSPIKMNLKGTRMGYWAHVDDPLIVKRVRIGRRVIATIVWFRTPSCAHKGDFFALECPLGVAPVFSNPRDQKK